MKQPFKCEDMLLFSVLYCQKFNNIWVLDSWLNKSPKQAI